MHYIIFLNSISLLILYNNKILQIIPYPNEINSHLCHAVVFIRDCFLSLILYNENLYRKFQNSNYKIVKYHNIINY